MRQIFGLLFLFSIVACGDSGNTNKTTVATAVKGTDTTQHETLPTVFNPYGIDTAYEMSKELQPFMLTGFFNPDDILDTAVLIRHKSTSEEALFIKHGGT